MKPLLKNGSAAKSEQKRSSSVFSLSAIAVVAVFVAAYFVLRPAPLDATAAGLAAEKSSLSAEQARNNLERLQKNGLAKTFFVRDFESIDGDGLAINGRTVIAGGGYTQVAATPGVVTATAVAGPLGCVSIEIADANGVYQLCLDNKQSFTAIVK